MNNRPEQMYNIAIGIPTYKRPLMLNRLILSIFSGNINRSLINKLWVVVLDNDIERTAEHVVLQIRDRDEMFSNVYYYHFPVKGYANVRNELLSKARSFDPDYIACIDDDEYPSEDWLNQLVLTISSTEADIAVGPVIRQCDENVPAYIAHWFTSHITNSSQQVRYFGAGNFIISVSFLKKHQLEFDQRFNSLGGEDTYFGISALKMGGRIVQAKNAIAYETVPEGRANRRWLTRKSFRVAFIYSYIQKIDNNYLAIFKKLFVSIIFIIVGTIALIAFLLPFKYRLWGLLKISEGIGGLAGFLKIRQDTR